MTVEVDSTVRVNFDATDYVSHQSSDDCFVLIMFHETSTSVTKSHYSLIEKHSTSRIGMYTSITDITLTESATGLRLLQSCNYSVSDYNQSPNSLMERWKTGNLRKDASFLVASDLRDARSSFFLPEITFLPGSFLYSKLHWFPILLLEQTFLYMIYSMHAFFP